MKKFDINWHFTVLQGLILILTGIMTLVLKGETSSTGCLLFSILIFFTGLPGIIEWVVNIPFDRSGSDLIFGIVTALMGLFSIFSPSNGMLLPGIGTSIWLMFAGIWLIVRGLNLNLISNMSWFVIASGLFSIIIGIIFTINRQNANLFSIVTGIQLGLTGIGFLVLAKVKQILFIS